MQFYILGFANITVAWRGEIGFLFARLGGQQKFLRRLEHRALPRRAYTRLRACFTLSKRDGEAFYASTRKDATAETRDLAAKLLSGEVVPSAAVRRLTPGAWVEQGQGVPDERLVSLQSRWKEGIYARLRGTRWYLYSKDAPPVSGATAAAALDSVPVIDALDSREAVA